MKKILFAKSLFVLSFIFILFNYTAPNANAISCDENTIKSTHTKDEWDAIIKECGNKLTETKNTGATLTSQINYMNTQINLTTAKIQNTQQSIKLTEKEIED